MIVYGNIKEINKSLRKYLIVEGLPTLSNPVKVEMENWVTDGLFSGNYFCVTYLLIYLFNRQ